MTRRQWNEVVLIPALAWLGVALGIGATCAFAFLGPSRLHGPVTLAIAAAQALVSGFVFMRLDRANAVIRFVAAGGFMWLSFLFILSFGDYLTRGYRP